MSVVMIDTHVVVALYKRRVSGLSRQAQRLLDGSTVFYSPVAVLELELLHEIGRAQVEAVAVCQFLNRELGINEGTERLNDIVRHALPLRFTRDPFDRLIVAHADLLRAPLITLDEHMRAHYPRAIH